MVNCNNSLGQTKLSNLFKFIPTSKHNYTIGYIEPVF